MTALPTPPAASDGARKLANQLRDLWGDMAPGELEKLIAAHVKAAVSEATKGLEAKHDAEIAVIIRQRDYWMEERNKMRKIFDAQQQKLSIVQESLQNLMVRCKLTEREQFYQRVQVEWEAANDALKP